MVKNKPFLFIVCLLTLVGLFLLLISLFFRRANVIEVPLSALTSRFSTHTESEKKSGGALNSVVSGDVSHLTGLACKNYNRRPFAVMLASDVITRPLAGVSSADLVFEMPVVEGGITRLMAVFLCNDPAEIGSIRSSRHDFIPLAAGLDAIYAHWGGSHFALDLLNKKVIDNIDALKNPFAAFYRKQNIAAPHNGFSSMDRLLNSAKKLNYRLVNEVVGYPHRTEAEAEEQLQNNLLAEIIEVGYAHPFNVEWRYEKNSGNYYRWRGGTKEIDKNNGQQVSAKNIVVMRVVTRQLEGQYNEVDVEGSGRSFIFMKGKVIEGSWQKAAGDSRSKLTFYDDKNQEIKLVPGVIWIELAPTKHKVSW